MSLDRRLNAFRDDLADSRLRDAVAAPRYVEGRPARVIVGEAAVHRSPDSRAERDTFFHYGEGLLAFEVAAGWTWCQSQVDSYVGYVEANSLALGPPPKPTHFVATPASYTYEEPDLRAPVRDFLPRHSAVAVIEIGLMTRGTEYAALDTGGYLPLGCLSPQPPSSADLVAAAELYLGSPYLWAGRSLRGIDCSALVQNAFRDLGIGVPRDTDLQRDAIGQRVVASTIEALRRGDLLYMPGHVLIYAGNGTVIHADGGTMTVRRDDLRAWLAARPLALSGFVIRRPAITAA